MTSLTLATIAIHHTIRVPAFAFFGNIKTPGNIKEIKNGVLLRSGKDSEINKITENHGFSIMIIHFYDYSLK